MLRYKRPAEPPQFATTVAPFKTNVAKSIDLIKRAQKRSTGRKRRNNQKKKASDTKPSTIEFEQSWKKYKDIFSYVQFGKCGFCESNVKKTGHGDVDHYYPKAAVWELSDSDGARKTTILSTLGYWWLAYDWTNYLFACSKCNQTYKGSYFPVKEKTRRLPPDQRPTKKFPKETPLLLNPYGRIDPSKHLKFDKRGTVVRRNRSRFGYETIRTCFLNRPELVEARGDIAVRAFALIQSFAKRGNSRNLSTLRDMYLLGRDSRDHVGMVRAVFRDSGLNWENLVRLYAQQICNQLKRANATETVELESDLEVMGRERYEHWKSVRHIYKKSTKTTWNCLVRKRSEQLIRDLLRAQRQLDITDIKTLQRLVYEIGRESPSSLNTVTNIFETKTGLSWAGLAKVVGK